MSLIESDALKTSEFIEEAFKFWFKDNDHVRSPFPEYIQSKLKIASVEKFNFWINNLKPEAKDELNDEIIAEKFEEALFEEASKLVITEDEHVSILYPFLPRIGDSIHDENDQTSTISDRSIQKIDENNFLKLKCQNSETKEFWETSFQLPT